MPRAYDILDLWQVNKQSQVSRSTNEHMKSVRLPSSIPTSDDVPLEDDSLSGRIQEYCSRRENHRRCEKDTHYVSLNSIKEYTAKPKTTR